MNNDPDDEINVADDNFDFPENLSNSAFSSVSPSNTFKVSKICLLNLRLDLGGQNTGLLLTLRTSVLCWCDGKYLNRFVVFKSQEFCIKVYSL